MFSAIVLRKSWGSLAAPAYPMMPIFAARLGRVIACAVAFSFVPLASVQAQSQTGALTNLSTRLRLPAGGSPAIVGCVLAGGGAQTLLIRAVGPGLTAFGVGNTLADPSLTVYDAAGRVVASNDNWDGGGNAAAVAQRAGAFALSDGSRDAAVVLSANAGAYTVHVAGVGGAGGVVLIEVYAVDVVGPQLVNLSVRGTAGTGSDTLTAGFAVRGTARTLLMRGIGPGLAAFGVQGALPDPQVQLLDSPQRPVDANNDWGGVNDRLVLDRATAAVAAFPLAPGSRDAALTRPLEAGAYTMQVTDSGGRTGEALVEVYDASAFDPYATCHAHVRSGWSTFPTTSGVPVLLTHSPMAIADLDVINPMGLAIFEHVTPADHLYLWPANRNSAPGTYPVYAPGNGVITLIQHRASFEGDGGQQQVRNDYRIVFEHSSTMYSYYDLVDVMDPAILAQIPGGVPMGGGVRTRVPVSGGQLIGRIGGRTLDFAVLDLEKPDPGFLTPDFYASESWKVFTVDAFEAFEPGVRQQMLTKASRTAAPRGGKIGYDRAGRLVGNWFLAGTNGYSGAAGNNGRGYWTGHLSIAYHYIDADKIVLSFGEYGGGGATQFGVKGNAPLPDGITRANGIVKYELIRMGLIDGPRPFDGTSGAVQGTVLFEVLEGERLRMELFQGKSAAEVGGFTAAARIYER